METACMNMVLTKNRSIRLSYYSLDRVENERNFMEESARLVSNNVSDIRKVDVNKFDVK